MKKTLSTAFMIAVLTTATAFTTFADGTDPNQTPCGHINNPVYNCEPPPPPPPSRRQPTEDDDSILEAVKDFLSESFGYFLN